MEVSKGASIAIIAVVVVVVLGAGYFLFLKPKNTSVGGETREKYMQMMNQGRMGSGPNGSTPGSMTAQESARRMMSAGGSGAR
jgi:hypothetical protein